MTATVARGRAAVPRRRLRSAARRLVRPTLRLRLTLLNFLLLLGSAALLLILVWLLAEYALQPADGLAEGSTAVLSDGTELDWRQWEETVLAEARTELLAKAAAGIVVITLVGAGAAYLVVGRALQPLHRVTATAQRLSGQTLDQRIRYSGTDDEVAELADTFDAMLDRLGDAFTAQQRFVANASHELRTPLAVMRTEIDVTLSDPDADAAELRRMGEVVRDASQRANALVDSLLILARSEARTGLRRQPYDLADGARAALDAMATEIERISVIVTTDLRSGSVVGDPSLLERLAGNLIENAVRYNHYRGRIEVRTGVHAGLARLVVVNTGFELAQHDVAGMFEPFRRGGRERTGARGAGLGLSIVKAVCDAHGGTAGVIARDGGGLEVTVALPAA